MPVQQAQFLLLTLLSGEKRKDLLGAAFNIVEFSKLNLIFHKIDDDTRRRSTLPMQQRLLVGEKRFDMTRDIIIGVVSVCFSISI